MIASTSGIEVRARSRALRDAVELIPSMRFSISLLTAICIASGIATVVKQHAPYRNEVNQCGPFWAECFAEASPYTVSSAWWFLLILTFLVMSTRPCTACNAPKIIAGLRTYKEQVREQALAAVHDEGQAELPETPVQAFEPISAQLQAAGWKTKLELRKDGEIARGTTITARRGAATTLGHIAVHPAIVSVCAGGLFDGGLVVRAQMALQGKRSFSGGGTIRDAAAANRLGPATPPSAPTCSGPKASAPAPP